MTEFFHKTGNTKLRFKPAYNPYTEVRFPFSSFSFACPFRCPLLSRPCVSVVAPISVESTAQAEVRIVHSEIDTISSS